ncbi:MAG: hypothetical protein B7Y80_18000 [Hyphomicrobium sp. 32-62-53]|nr:MAG: hypothetical protein B7Z29_19230 [Hyphomicrobium sp. 12-62-95]OYX97856.1 MAG: hypothetical protein B7Y80_18000 [Hyphomicrobium sp. 32-62-53]
MRQLLKRSALLAILIAGTATAALPHHTYVKKYDSAKKLTLSGTVENVRFSNPHIFFTLETAKGSWTIETESISVAKAKGLTTTHLKSGAKATVTGWPARGGGAELGLATISFPGGPSVSIRGTAR